MSFSFPWQVSPFLVPNFSRHPIFVLIRVNWSFPKTISWGQIESSRSIIITRRNLTLRLTKAIQVHLTRVQTRFRPEKVWQTIGVLKWFLIGRVWKSIIEWFIKNDGIGCEIYIWKFHREIFDILLECYGHV